MASQIEEIYTAFKNSVVTVGSKSITVKEPATLPNSIQTANLPLRLLTPISRFSTGFATSNSTWNSGQGSQKNQIDWVITDLFLYDALNQQIGVKALSSPLVEYCKNYLDMMANFELPSSCWISNISLRCDVFDYPIGIGIFYYGVIALVSVTEKIN